MEKELTQTEYDKICEHLEIVFKTYNVDVRQEFNVLSSMMVNKMIEGGLCHGDVEKIFAAMKTDYLAGSIGKGAKCDCKKSRAKQEKQDELE